MNRRRQRTIRNKGVIAAARAQRTPPPGERLAFRVDPWTRRIIRPLLISALAASLAVAILVIVQISSPDEPWLGVAFLCWLAALEGAYTAAWLNNPDSHGVDRAAYRVAEILLLMVLVRVYTWLLFGLGIPSRDEMRLFLTAPLSLLATGGFVTATLGTLIAWWMAVSTSRTFAHLDISIYEVQFYTLSQAEQKAKADDRPIQIPRQELLSRYLTSWLTIGMLIIVLAALSTYEVNQFATVTNPFEITRLGLRPAMLFALLTYFLAGLWLLSHARLLRMNAHWLIDGFAKEASLERGWQRSSLVLLLAIAFITAFLPIGSTLAISRILFTALNGLAYLASLIYSFFGALFAAVLVALTRNAEQQPPQQPLDIPPLPTPAPNIPPVAPNPVVTMLISSAFWALMIAIVIGSLLFFLRERGYRLDVKQVRSYWGTTKGWLRDLWARLTGHVRMAGNSLRVRLREASANQSAPGRPPLSRPRLFRLGSLSPREQIRYYYLALVRRAGERGVRRTRNQTPLEYTQALTDEWPEAEGDLEEITTAFLEARYSRKPFGKGDVNPIRERWNRLKARLRARRLAD
jgi:hypothetical protein